MGIILTGLSFYNVDHLEIVIEKEKAISKRLTEKVKEEREIALKSEAKFKAILETTPNGIIVIDNHGNITLANQSFTRSYEKIFQKIIPNGLNIGIHKDYPLMEVISDIIYSPESGPMLVEPISGFYLQSFCSRYEMSKDVTLGFIIEFVNVTPFVQLENIQKRFIMTVSHELRTPVTSMDLSIQNLLKYKNKMSEDQQTYLLDCVSENLAYITRILEDALAISKIDNKEFQVKFSSYNLGEVAKSSLIQLEAKRKEKRITIESNIDQKIWLYGDPLKIDHILRIIVENAIKFSSNDSTIKIRALDQYQGEFNPEGVDGTLIQISDSGIGIKEEDLPYIFDRFFKTRDTRDIQGMGLRLAIAKHLVNLHKGEIFVESEYSKGATFHLFLPRVETSVK